MQIWVSTFTSGVFLSSSSVVYSQSFICASGQRLSFQNKTGDLTKHWCDEITALWKTSHSHLYAAWMRSLPRYQLQPDILHLLPHCLLKTSEYIIRNHVYSHLSIPPPGFTAGTSGNWWNLSTALVCYFPIPLISFISGLSWISLSRRSTNLANTSPMLD